MVGMYITNSRLVGLNVISLQTGQTLSQISRPLIDYQGLEIVALVCAGRTSTPPVVMARDIRELTSGAVLINSADDLSDSGEIVRLAPLLKDRFRLVGLTVRTELGTRLGRVESYTIDTETYRVQKLYIRQPMLKALFLGSLIIDRTQIVDVGPKTITVRDATLKETVTSAQPATLK